MKVDQILNTAHCLEPSSHYPFKAFLAFKHIKHTVVDSFRSLLEKCVPETAKDGTEIF